MEPPDHNGTDVNSKIGRISIGMCNSSKEFAGQLGVQDATQAFVYRVMKDSFGQKWKNPKLVVVDCAQAHMSADEWASDDNNLTPWVELDRRLRENSPGGRVSQQVQIVWLKEALAGPEEAFGPWPIHAQDLQDFLETILDRLVDDTFAYHLENLKMVFFSRRSRAWTMNHDGMHDHSPEPYAYETGFADKWVIQEKIDNEQPDWPWLSWGPYIWADGLKPRSDRFKWFCTDVQDCVHPTDTGVGKVADQLLAFFKTDPVARPWFLKSPNSQFTVNATTSCDHDEHFR
jgi:hypothetical protein